MAILLENGMGEQIEEPTAEQMRRFLDELDPNDEEHGAAWVVDDQEHVLEWNVDGTLVWDGAEPSSRHMSGVSKAEVLRLWQMLAQGLLHEIERQPWRMGLRPPLSPEEAARREKERADQELAWDREFFLALGVERPEAPCRHDGCSRGAVAQSLYCRVHHFEQIRRRPCPFSN